MTGPPGWRLIGKRVTAVSEWRNAVQTLRKAREARRHFERLLAAEHEEGAECDPGMPCDPCRIVVACMGEVAESRRQGFARLPRWWLIAFRLVVVTAVSLPVAILVDALNLPASQGVIALAVVLGYVLNAMLRRWMESRMA